MDILIGLFLIVIAFYVGKIKAEDSLRSEYEAYKVSLEEKFKNDFLKDKEAMDMASKKLELYYLAHEEFQKSFLKGRKWLADKFAELNSLYLKEFESSYRNKKRPAKKAADQLREERKERRKIEARLKYLEAEIATIHEYFPFTEEFRNEILQDDLDKYDIEEEGKIDPIRYYLTKEEYESLSDLERNERALKNYIHRQHSKWEIGKLYERYIGYLYEKNDYIVTYRGILMGYQDEGIDLVCYKDDETLLVQAKCWSENKVIHEKHIFQLYATSIMWQLDNPTDNNIKCVFVTTTKLSDRAKQVACRLGVGYYEKLKLDKNFPMIKLHISKTNQGEKIYHLPMDQQYDRIKNKKTLSRVYQVKEAEELGYRRAFRYQFEE